MKSLVCDICGGKLQMVTGGIARCEYCGMEYTQERMQEKIQEIKGTVTVSGPVQTDSSHLVDNYLNMAETALNSGNNPEAELYCNKVIEVKPENHKAWMYKGKATAWQSTFAHIRITEAVNCWSNAISYCPDEEKEELQKALDQEMTSLTIAMFDLAAGFLASGMNQHKHQAFRNHVNSILSCLKIYASKINVNYKWIRAWNQGVICAAPHIVKSATAVKDLYHKLKPTNAEVRNEYLQEMVLCIDIAERLANPTDTNAKAKAACYTAMMEIAKMMDNIGSYHWFDGSTIYRTDVCGKYFTDDMMKFAKLAGEWKSKVPEEEQKEYWEDHPEEYKEYRRKQREERLRKEKEERERREREIQAEKEKQKALAGFWENHAEEKLAIKKELDELAEKRRTLLKANSGVEQVKLINERIRLLEEILRRDRYGKTSFMPGEQKTLNGQTEFAEKMQKAAHYDSYLDTYPILKEKAAIDKEMLQLNEEKNKLSATDKGRKALLLLGIGFSLLGILFIYLGVLMDAGFLTFLAVSLLLGGSAFLIVAISASATVAPQKAKINKSMKELAFKQATIASIPAYTEDFDAKAAAEEKGKKKKA